MTTTRHTISATMAVDPAYWRNASDVPVWADSVQGAVQWAPYDSSIAVWKVLNAATGRYELRLDWNRSGAGTTQSVTHEVTTVVGKSYRVVASMYALMAKMTAQTGGSPSSASTDSPSRDLTTTPFEVWGVFTATSTSSFLFIKSPSPWAVDPPTSGTVYVTQVALYEVVSTTTVDLRPMQAVARLDSEWSPYVRVDLTCPLPPADALSRIDPRGVSSSGTLRTTQSRAVVTLDSTGLEVVSGVQRRNRHPNPRGTSAFGWVTEQGGGSPTASTVTVTPPFPGGPTTGRRATVAGTTATYLQVRTANTIAQAIPVTVGVPAPLSLWAILSYTSPVTVYVQWLNAAAGVISTDTFVAGTLEANTWKQYTRTLTPPAGSVAASILVRATTSPVPAGGHLTVTAAATEAGDWFDGDTPDTFTLDYAWTGTPNASTSTASAINPNPGLTTTRVLDVHLRVRDVDYVAGTMRLELTGDEMYLQDFARYDTSTSTWRPPATSSLRTLVSWALGLFGWVLQAGTDATIDSTKVVWNLGETLWDFLDSYVRGSGKRLWCDENRRWWLTPSNPSTSGTYALITALTSCTDALSRADEAYGDAAVMEYTWVDAGGVSHRDYAYTYTTGLTTPKTVVQRFTDQQPVPGSVGTGVATLRTRAMSRGRAIRVRAVSSYAVTPGQEARIVTPVTTVTGAVVSAVTWNLPEDEMDVRTRDVVT